MTPLTPPSPDPELRPYAWSTEHLLLREASGSPRELGQMLDRARVRHAAHPKLVGRLVLSETVKELFAVMLEQGLLMREPGGYVLTPEGEARLEYLHRTQIVEPYLVQVRVLHGPAAAQQLRLELIR